MKKLTGMLLGLGLVAFVSALALTPSSSASTKPRQQGLFGAIQFISGGLIRLDSKQGPVELKITPESEIRTGSKEPLSLHALKPGDRVAVLALLEPGGFVARRVMRIPEEPKHIHVTGTVVDVSGGTVTLQTSAGVIPVQLGQLTSPDRVGDTLVVVAQREPESTTGFRNAKATVKVEKVLERLERHLLRAGEELNDRVGKQTKAVKEHRRVKTPQSRAKAEAAIEARESAKRTLVDLRARLEASTRFHMNVLQRVLEQAPESAKPALRNAIEASQRAQTIAQKALDEAEAISGESASALTSVEGRLQSVDPATGAITLEIADNPSLTLHLTEETIIKSRGILLTPADLTVGSEIEAQFNPETREALRLQVKTKTIEEAKGTLGKFDPSTGQHLIELDDGSSLEVKLTEDTIIRVEGKLFTSSVLQEGLRVEVKFNPQTKEALRLIIQAPEVKQEATGIIRTVDVASGIIGIELADGAPVDLRITDDTKILVLPAGGRKGAGRQPIAAIQVGDRVEFQFHALTRELLQVKTRKPRTVSTTELRGLIQAIDLGQGTLIMELPTGETIVLKISERTTYRIDGFAALATSITPGMRVAAELSPDGGEVLLLDALSRVAVAGEVEGVIQFIDFATGILFLAVETGGVAEIKVDPGTRVLIGGEASSYFDLRRGSQITVQLQPDSNVAESVEVKKQPKHPGIGLPEPPGLLK